MCKQVAAFQKSKVMEVRKENYLKRKRKRFMRYKLVTFDDLNTDLTLNRVGSGLKST